MVHRMVHGWMVDASPRSGWPPLQARGLIGDDASAPWSRRAAKSDLLNADNGTPEFDRGAMSGYIRLPSPDSLSMETTAGKRLLSTL